jgi:hypothetical protein
MKYLSIALFVIIVMVLIGFFYTKASQIEEFFAMSPGTLVQLASTRAERPVMIVPYPMKKREYAMIDNMMNDRMEVLYQAVAQPRWIVDRIGYSPYSLQDAIVVLDH